MSKIEPLTPVSASYGGISKLNGHLAKIETALENTVSRDGSAPNAMLADFDVNSNRIINVLEPVNGGDVATKTYVDTFLGAVTGLATPIAHTWAKLVDGTLTLQTYAAARALASLGTNVTYSIRGRAAETDGGHGDFYYDAADTTTADNGGTVLVTASGQRLKRKILGNQIHVEWFGTGTTAFDTANTLANNTGSNGGILVVGGGNFTYGGTGLVGPSITVLGQGPQETVISLDAGKYFVDDPGIWGALRIERIRFVGGAGAIRSLYTSTMVQAKQIVRDCEFLDYTGPAISNNSSDSPDWTIENNVFNSANSTTTIGVALKGLTDSNRIFGNSFRKNRVHVKLAEGGNNAYLAFNDFLRFDAGSNRIDIWCVPDVDGTNAGSGLSIGPNKFGNENRATDGTDIPVLYADEGAGTYWGDRLPGTGVSTGFISGHRIDGAAFYFNGGSPNTPIVYSRTPNVYGCHYTNITMGGTRPTYILQFQSAPSAFANGDAYFNAVGPLLFDAAAGASLVGFAPASSYNSVRVVDVGRNYGFAEPYFHQLVTESVAAGTTVYAGANGSNTTDLFQWRPAVDIIISKLELYCVTGAVGAGGSVTAAVYVNNVLSAITTTFAGAAAFGGAATGTVAVGAANKFNVVITANASALAQRYVVVVTYRRA